jgi:TRAP-type uncharacterized transport system fused permease subunit
LIVLPEYFTWVSFLQVSLSCALGIFAFATVVSGFFLAPLNVGWRIVMGISGLLLVAPSWESDLVALVIAVPVVLSQVAASRRLSATATAAVGGDSE